MCVRILIGYRPEIMRLCSHSFKRACYRFGTAMERVVTLTRDWHFGVLRFPIAFCACTILVIVGRPGWVHLTAD
jgi:hypothetical protein